MPISVSRQSFNVSRLFLSPWIKRDTQIDEDPYDETKRQTNLTKHGYDFADLYLDFFENSVVIPARAGRLMAIGVLRDGTIAVVFATLGTEGISIISMRHASRKERTIL